ncbi:Gfo/Idh/MocA family protein [Radiobacillus deserti]|uniref:Gfo/Idh/MocA family oxidoreductase n=1 Tax=Radiobacillus deserti TaxID=2594883 RepID=A0A516KD72_9BACI|nr:Gfo/Idh/MocA family oxidoreductase [Radiobacillus deserti]QDP39246.1 Gfo/Idh/MocA family oxidoreductase [Radiobacillus deserti]
MVRFGVIGTNWITESFLDGARQLEDFLVTTVYSRSEEKAKEFAEKHGATHTYTDLDEFAESKEFDAVYIASPNSFHAEQAILCMNHGKHVIIEKSIASNAKEVERIMEASKNNGVVAMEALKTTFLPNFQTIQENLHKLGPIRRYFASYCQYSSRYDAYKEGTILNAFNPKFSNGSLMDIGVYCTYPMVALFGKPKKLLASSLLLESGVDGQGSIMFEYEAMSGVIMYSKISNSYVPSEIQGEKGSMLIDNFNSPTHVEIRYKDGTVEDITREQVDNTMYYEAKAFLETIQSGKKESDVNTLERSLITSQLLEEARKQTGVVFPADQ